MNLLCCFLIILIYSVLPWSNRVSGYNDKYQNVATTANNADVKFNDDKELLIKPKKPNRKEVAIKNKDGDYSAAIEYSIIKKEQEKEKSRNNLFKNVEPDHNFVIEFDHKPKFVVRSVDTDIIKETGKTTSETNFEIDPVLNSWRRRASSSLSSSSAGSWELSETSSSQEKEKWKNEYRAKWLETKIYALKYMNRTSIDNEVKLIAARPWGVPCGDPTQHDMPWGTCMLALECSPEFRIYRGDQKCGRTEFVCCSLITNAYDMNMGISLSFEDSDLKSSSDEGYNREDSKERRKRRKRKDKNKRKRDRDKRKKKIRRDIDKIIRQIRRVLKKISRNATSERKKKTRQLKRFIKHMKRQYKRDRWAVREYHDMQLIYLDINTKQKLWEVRDLNRNFDKNQTFRNIINQIVFNNTVTRKNAEILVDSFPELSPYFNFSKSLRRFNGGGLEVYQSGLPIKDTEYDEEFGILYY